MKKRILLVLVCTTLFLSTIVVSAAERSTVFGSGESYAKAYLHTFYGFGEATTTPTTSFYTMGVQLRFLGDGYNYPWAIGEATSDGKTCVAYQAPADLDGVYQAESYHFVDTVATFLTAPYY